MEGARALRILSNDLERAALEEADAEAPDLAAEARRIRGLLVREGAHLASMSGSGSAWFGLFDDGSRARRAHTALAAAGFRVIRTRTLSLDQYRRTWARSLRRGITPRGRTG